MTEEEQEDKNKGIRPLERARGKKSLRRKVLGPQCSALGDMGHTRKWQLLCCPILAHETMGSWDSDT